VLHKVELLVAGGGPEVVALDGVFLGAGAAVFTHDDGAALLAKRRVGQHHLKALAGVSRQRVAHHHGHRFFRANAVQHHVHGAHAGRGLHQLVAGEGLFLQVLELVARQALVVAGDVVVRGEQEAARATGRVGDALAGLRGNAVHHGLDERARREVLACAALGVLRVLFQQALIGIALHVGAQNRPGFGANQIHDHAAQLGRVLELVLRLAKNQAQRAFFLPSFSSAWR
jgi:hypothetical protein